ncbi:GNAT family N-acetyltransferase [Neisseria sp. 23W00296]|uniref:GNAT family N-acetyltransferase n=1 Tax=unclassified Neisseria TaxID=2623750 RepID=UPI000B8C10B2|nr:GNAT family N-acetyltransferase [Neisseria sp. KEM232]ASP17490.1 GNAT family N-acetyltransferase [Neisseria sp. KEM232]
MNTVTHQPERRRFVLTLEGREAGFAAYEEQNGGWNITHTEVMPEFQGRGLAKILVQALVGHARTHGIALYSSCGYAARFLDTPPTNGAKT